MLDIKNIHFVHILYDMECFFCYSVHISILSESCTFIGISFLWFWKPYNIFENIFCAFFSFFFLLHLQFIGCYLYSVLQLKHIQVIFFFISLFLTSKFIFPLSDTISTELLFHLFFLISMFILVWVFFRNFFTKFYFHILSCFPISLKCIVAIPV